MEKVCYIGIDGGGTKTVGVSMDETGNVLARAEDESINYCSVGLEAATATLSRLVDSLCRKSESRCGALAVGSSALDERVRDTLYQAFLEKIKADPILGKINEIVIKSDAYMALLALCDEKRGAILIAGTGVMGLAKDGEHLHSVAGWGDLFLDRGSGYYIAHRALTLALDYADGLCPAAESLFYAMCGFFELSSAGELIQTVYAPDFDKGKLAAFSAVVASLAEKGDTLSLEILRGAADELVRYAVCLGDFLGKESFPLGFYGSVLEKNLFIRTRVCQELKKVLPQATVSIPACRAQDAAALYIIRRTHK